MAQNPFGFSNMMPGMGQATGAPGMAGMQGLGFSLFDLRQTGGVKTFDEFQASLPRAEDPEQDGIMPVATIRDMGVGSPYFMMLMPKGAVMQLAMSNGVLPAGANAQKMGYLWVIPGPYPLYIQAKPK